MIFIRIAWEATMSDFQLGTAPPMWYEGMGYYFKGPEDPNFCVLQFVTQRYSLMLNEHDVNGSARGTL